MSDEKFIFASSLRTPQVLYNSGCQSTCKENSHFLYTFLEYVKKTVIFFTCQQPRIQKLHSVEILQKINLSTI